MKNFILLLYLGFLVISSCSNIPDYSSAPPNEPEINIRKGNVAIVSGDTAFFGQAIVTSTVSVLFTIENQGGKPLSLNLPLALSGTDTDVFSITGTPDETIPAGGSTTFKVAFKVTSTATKNVLLNIGNNDADEGVYQLNLSGKGIVQGTLPFQSEEIPPALGNDDNGLYVATNGSDTTGNGTIGSPYATIQHVLYNDIAKAGDTIILRGGTYNESIRIQKPNITIRSYGGENAVIQQPYANESDPGQVVRIDVGADGTKLQNLEIIGGSYYNIKLESKWDWGDDTDRSGVSNVTIENCKIHDSGRDCIKIVPNCNDIVIRGCEIYNSGKRVDSNAEGIDNVNGDRVIVQDCYIHDIATNGLYFKGGATDCVAERVIVENTGGAGIMLGFDTSPEYFDLDVNPGYYENINGIVRNCIIRGTKYSGIGMFAAFNPQVYNNTIIDTAKTGHSPIYFGLTYQDWDPEAGRPSTVNAIIKNNIVYQNAPTNQYFVYIRYSKDLGGMSALSGMPVMSNNVYYRTNTSVEPFGDARPDSSFFGNLSEWKTHINGDANSFEANPLFDGTYHLTAESPCVDKGFTLTFVSFDMEKQRRTGTYDIGADER